MADDEEKKDDGAEEEKKDGEEEERDGEEGDDDDDDDEGDDDFGSADAKNFPPQAREWSLQHFGSISKARLFQYAEKRSADDIQEMAKPRKWRVEIRNIRFVNFDEIADLFIQFQFGHNFKLKKKFDRPRASAGGKASKAKGARKYKWVETGTQGHTYLTNVIRNVDINAEVEFATSFRDEWKGSYFDLYEKVLHIEIWDWNQYATNNFIASHDIPLVSIARGAMFQEVTVIGEFKDPDKKRKEKREVGALTFVCIFQEVLDFELKFLNWEALLKELIFPSQEDRDLEDVKYNSYAKFFLNKRAAKSPAAARRLRLTSRVDSQQPGAEVETLRAMYTVPATRVMRLRGIRNDVEAAELDVLIMNKTFTGGSMLAFTRIPLKGVTISGYLQSQLGYLFVHRVMDKEGRSVEQKDLLAAGEIKGQVDLIVPKAPLWKEFVQSGELNPPELRDFPPYNYTYLAVKVIRCSTLPAADENGFSDPFVSLEWGGQRQLTRVKRQTLDPVFEETLYFHVRCYQEFPSVDDVSKFPYVSINVWDHDESGASDNLGAGRLYLHQITGSVRDDRPVTQNPLKRIKVKKRKSKWNPRLVEHEVRTRVYRGRIQLAHPDPMMKPAVFVEAWFRGPQPRKSNVIDLLERDERRRRLLGDLMLLPHYDDEADRREKATCVCFRGRDEAGMRKVCDNSVTRGRCDTVAKFEADMRMRGGPPGQRMLEEAKRGPYNRLVIRTNEDRQPSLLPSFLQPLVPPKDMAVALDKDFGFEAFEEARYRPNTAKLVFDFVCSIEFTEGHGADGEADEDDPDCVYSPNFVLDARRGTVRDHAFLLCNLFLGIGLDAYLVVGTAERPQKGNPTVLEEVEHFWVMTREDHNGPAGEPESEWYTNGGAVQFWEVATGRRYVLKARWDGTDRDSWGKKRKRRRRRGEDEDDGEGEEEAKAHFADDGEGEELLDEEDILRMIEEEEDTHVKLDEIFLAEAGTGDGWGRVPQHKVMRRLEIERDLERERAAEEERARIAAEEAKLVSTPAYKERMRLIRSMLESERQPVMPYRSVTAVFNHKNLWVNVQRSRTSILRHPAEISYDFGSYERDKEDTAWVPLLFPEVRNVGADPVPFYPARGLGAKLSEDRVEELQREIVDELEAGLVNVRNALNMRTRVVPNLRSAVLDVLLTRHKLDGMDRNEHNGWDFAKKDWVKDMKKPGYAANVAYLKSLQRLSSTVPPGYNFRMAFCRLNSTDATTIRKAVLNYHWGRGKHKVKIHLEDRDGKEQFTMAAKLFPLYNQVAVTRIGLMVIFPDDPE